MEPMSYVFIGLALAVFCTAFGALVVGKPRMPQRSAASKLKCLRKLPFLAALPEADILRVVKIVRELHVPADAFVVREHRVGEAMFLVLSGTLQVLKNGKHDQTLLQTVGPDEIIGEMALLTGARRIASIRSTTPCVLMQIMRDDFADLLAAHPEVARAVWDACETHSIDLALRDHERTRALTLDERRVWIASRKSVTTAANQTLHAASDGYLALIAGAAVRGQHPHQAPELVKVHAGDELTVTESGQVAWLPDPAKLAG